MNGTPIAFKTWLGSSDPLEQALPVLAQTGVIQPGIYVQYVDGAVTRTGIVRSTQVEVGEIDVYQTIGVEVRG